VNKTYKHSMIGSMLLIFILLLSACSNSSSSNPAATSTPDASAPAATAAAERTVKDALGHEVKLPANPQKILASYLEDHLVALGVKPVAQWSGSGGKSVQNYLQGDLKGIPTIPSELPYEAVMSFTPDLIIMGSAQTVEGDKYAQYAKIAPTYTVGTQQNNDWRQVLLTVGEVLNKSKEAKEALANYDKKANEAKEQLKQAIGTKSAAALWVTAKAVYVVHENLSSGAVLYQDLGLTAPKAVKEISKTATANWNPMSLEVLAELDADYLFIVNGKGVSKEELLKEPVWADIPAVKNGHVYTYGNEASWLYTGTIANRQIIDNVMKSILNK
jgi:iron complex transport system substrate-binding protein